MDWDAEAIERLRALWSEGHSTAAIGRKMGTSKNAIVGKAHRIDLPVRPNPVTRSPANEDLLATSAQPRRVKAEPKRGGTPRRQNGALRATLPVPVTATVVPTTAAEDPAVLHTTAPPPPVAEIAADPPAPVTPYVTRRREKPSRACCWPIGEPKEPGFRYCAGVALTGKPYCPEHAAVAYVKGRVRRDDTA